MWTLVRDLDAFLQEHRRCGEMDGGVEDDCVWRLATVVGHGSRAHCRFLIISRSDPPGTLDAEELMQVRPRYPSAPVRFLGFLFALGMLVIVRLDTLGRLYYADGRPNWDLMFFEGLYAFIAAFLGGAFVLYEKSVQRPSNEERGEGT
jgi:hypothetical protein